MFKWHTPVFQLNVTRFSRYGICAFRFSPFFFLTVVWNIIFFFILSTLPYNFANWSLIMPKSVNYCTKHCKYVALTLVAINKHAEWSWYIACDVLCVCECECMWNALLAQTIYFSFCVDQTSSILRMHIAQVDHGR